MFAMEYDLNLGIEELFILAAVGLLMVGSAVAVILLVLRGKQREDFRDE
jgi:hypothetical protein